MAEGGLARALEANERWERTAAELRAENTRLRMELACRDAELERVNAELAVLQRLVFGRSSERARPGAQGRMRTVEGAGARTGQAAGRAAGRAVRGRGRDGGITRICPGSR